jgi:nitroimidazol reductase NimA-like FMN-containing flavoprotein (pyridoxamine 5'-phosphate oxidase superfamily)
MRLVDGRTGIEVLDRDACVRLLARERVGRIAVVAGGMPVCLPVNFVLDDDRVVLRTAAGTKLDSAIRGSAVAFEVDDFDAGDQSGWSVMVSGRAEEVLDAEEVARLEGLPLRPWSPHEKSHWIVIHPESVTGRRLHAITEKG